MRARNRFRILTDGGAVHYECRRCSRNLSADHEECPDCGGPVASYDLE